MTPEVFCVGNGIDFSAVDDGFGDNVNTLGKKGLWLKLDGDSHQIGMRWGNSPEDMLLWQVEPSGYGIIKPFMDRIASDFEQKDNGSFAPVLPILGSWTDRARCSNPVTESPFGVFGNVIGSNIDRCVIVLRPCPSCRCWLKSLRCQEFHLSFPILCTVSFTLLCK